MHLPLASDKAGRGRLFGKEAFKHPAKAHLGLLTELIERYTEQGETVGDPMAGSGSLMIAAPMGCHVILREIEPQWLAIAQKAQARFTPNFWGTTISIGQADACQPWDFTADHLIFSPPYGCDARAPTSQETEWADELPINLCYGDSAGQMGHFRGKRYWQAMRQIYAHAYNALGTGVMALILKDHIYEGKRVHTVDLTIALCQELGFTFQERIAYPLPMTALWQRERLRKGLPVVDTEDVIVFRK